MKTIGLENKKIGMDQPIYVIAEIGGNFTDLETAIKLVDLARKAGADAIKLQHYKADTITSRKAIFEMENTGTVSQYELFKKYELGEGLTRDLFAYCDERRITAFSTPSHADDVDLLEKFEVPAFKVGSDDAVNIPFLKYIAAIGKPIFLSTGMCTMTEVQRGVDAVLEEGNDKIVLFHCVTNYPTPITSVNLRAMQAMQAEFPFPVGYSDHTLGIDACYAAAVLGARTLEFHFTYDKEADGPDHMLSKDFDEASRLIAKVRALEGLLGDGIKKPAATEMNTRRNNRKSLVLTRDVKKGEKLNANNMEVKRPGYGIACEHYYNLLGKTASRDLKTDEPLSWEDIV